jgi:hypothetical protein
LSSITAIFFALKFAQQTTQCTAQLTVVRYNAECAFEALIGVWNSSCRRGNLWNTCIVVNFGSRDGCAGVQMADNAVNFRVHQFLRNGCTLFRITAVIFSQQFEFYFLPPMVTPLAFRLFDRHFSAEFVVFTQVSNRAGNRTNVTNFNHHLLSRCKPAKAKAIAPASGIILVLNDMYVLLRFIK